MTIWIEDAKLHSQPSRFSGWFCTAALALCSLVAGGTSIAFVFFSLRHGVLRDLLALGSMGTFIAALFAWLPVIGA